MGATVENIIIDDSVITKDSINATVETAAEKDRSASSEKRPPAPERTSPVIEQPVAAAEQPAFVPVQEFINNNEHSAAAKPDEQVVSLDRSEEAGNVLHEASGLHNQISNATTPDSVNGAKAALEALATLPVVRNSATISRLVQSYIQAADARFSALSAQQDNMTADMYVTASGIHRLNPITEVLSKDLESLNLWSDKEKAKLESIDPAAQYKTVTFDKDGKPNGEASVSGQELRDAAALLKAHAHYDELDDKARKDYNRQTHGNDHAAQTPEERAKDTAALDHAGDVLLGQEAYGKPPEQQAQLGAADSQLRASHARVQALENGKDKLPPAMQAAAAAVIKDAEKKSRATDQSTIDSWVDDAPPQNKQVDQSIVPTASLSANSVPLIKSATTGRH